jgi:RNA polymerase-binding transcription factor DksA
MNDKTATQFKKLLLARRADLVRNLAHSPEDDPNPPDPIDETQLAPASLDPGTVHPGAHDRVLLQAFDAALTRIAESTYGACTLCGGEIGIRRLVAFPWARHCLACQARAEKQR